MKPSLSWSTMINIPSSSSWHAATPDDQRTLGTSPVDIISKYSTPLASCTLKLHSSELTVRLKSIMRSISSLQVMKPSLSWSTLPNIPSSSS
ncbi:hypothetical protein M758_4G246500 [Ceratodon purpureus]|nr:hypothetical protein M758_4G246500 [Ceratodon purpureus]